jgi:hypothetical protein
MPWCTDPEERKSRRRLLNARDLATSRAVAAATRELPAAVTLYWMIVDVASAWVFISADVERVKEVADFCLRLFQCAQSAEDLQGSGA